MFDIWVIPLIIVFAIILLISFQSIRKNRKIVASLHGEPDIISKNVEEHPAGLNPIFWVIGIASFFTFIMIFYYWASYP